jgi:hypothetical protein
LEEGIPIRDVRDLDLFEVSLLDRTKTPAYDGTLVTVRAEDEVQFHGEPLYFESEIREMDPEEPEETEEATEETTEELTETRDEPKQHEDVEKPIDYSEYEKTLADMKGEN